MIKAIAISCMISLLGTSVTPAALIASAAPATTPVRAGYVEPEPTPTVVDEANAFDFVSDSITDVSKSSKKHFTASQIKENIKSYGSYIYGDTLSYKEYKSMMDQKWVDVTEKGKYKKLAIDLKKTYHIDDFYEMLKDISRINGITLFKIGESQEGRDILAIDINRGEDDNKEILLLTGSVHSRETAGTTFIMAELIDLANKIKDKDANTLDLLSRCRIVAVPCTNPDGHEGICFNASEWTYSSGELKKCLADGTDLNRNFCGLSWGMVKKGATKSPYISTSSKKIYYPGAYPASAPETKAMEKFIYYFVGVKKAKILLDYHQQGGIYYAGKPYQTKEQLNRCIDLASSLRSINGKYARIPEVSAYGLIGEGSTLTDYAVAVAVGAKFSRNYGFYVMEGNGKEYPLIMCKNTGEAYDGTKFAERNSKFMTSTFEIGIGRSYLGYTANTRSLIANEYKNRHFDTMLYDLMKKYY